MAFISNLLDYADLMHKFSPLEKGKNKREKGGKENVRADSALLGEELFKRYESVS